MMRGFFTASLWIAAATPAAAQTEIPREVADGMYVTVAEVRANSDRTFRFFAGPGGGPISRESFVSTDLPAGLGPSGADRKLLGKLFDLLDANENGQLTREEWESRINRDLQFADQNGDGRVTLKELSKARQNMSIGDTLGMVF